MYNEHFGFLESPFTATSNSRFFYSNDLYQEALANLRYGIQWKKGLIVMTGEVGTGKTTLLVRMMRSLEATTHPVFLSYDHLTYTELLRLVSKELGLQSDPENRLATVDRLRDYLIAQHRRGHVVALLIDEAQNLSDEMFESIRFLSNLETETEKLLQIVLTGQPELETRLDQPSLRHLKQRIVLHCRLAPLKSDEVGRYINLRLQEAGYEGKGLFDPDAVSAIAFHSGGIPRLINIICDNALVLAFAGSRKTVSAEMIREVARDLGLKNQSQIRAQAAPALTEAINESEEEKKIAVDEPWSTGFNGSTNSIGPERQPMRREKSELAWRPAGIFLALVAFGGVGSVLYSQQIRDYLRPSAIDAEDSNRIRQYHLAEATAGKETLQPTPSGEDRRLWAQDSNQNNLTASKPPRSQVSIVPPAEVFPTPAKANASSQAAEPQPITSKTKRTQRQDREIETKEKESPLGNFEVAGPFSFVRRTPRSDAEIIATLQPLTRLKVVSATGDYFRIQASMDGRTIRGYVHREDAFFARIKTAKQRKFQNR
jgi:general secretion pathway protein A